MNAPAPIRTVFGQSAAFWCNVTAWLIGLISDNPALIINLLKSAPVAQLDRASDFESAGRPFESGRARQIFQQLTSENRRVVPNWGANCAGFVRVPLVAGGFGGDW